MRLFAFCSHSSVGGAISIMARTTGTVWASNTRAHWRYFGSGGILSSNRRQCLDSVIAQVAKNKKLELVGWPKKNMYIEDVTEFTHVILTTTEMMFVCTICVPGCRGAAWLTDRTNRNEFKIPEIIFDSTLVLSPHVTLLTMLFHIKGFKLILTTGLVLDLAEKLYSVNMLEGKGEQWLLLKNELLDKFVFCQTEPTPTGYQICLELMLTAAMVRSCMHRAGEITGFEVVAHLYNLQYTGAKTFNNSKEVSEALQNVMLQHVDICIFVKHYQVDVDVDIQGIVWKTGSQTALLSSEELWSLNYLPVVLAWQDTVKKYKWKLEDCKVELECANQVCKTVFGHLDDKVLAESYLKVLEKLEVFCNWTVEAKSEHNKAVSLKQNTGGESTQSTRELHSVVWKKDDCLARPPSLADALCLLMMMMLSPRPPSGSGARQRTTPRLFCAKQWTLCGLTHELTHKKNSGLGSAFSVLGILIAC
ncbi:conserved hypothetical protein [Coccidioides posadasii str. Silveira]|uniref:Uncharacterized protein n=1 Tax=Coccidioides posadasii (strain RMSCC 757 / Silveira) TaxID=443226 RepID=E9DC38_COCPS|nr:conserved hypothetical protein [Coccidioides posadasii str. Silveira]